MKGGGKGKGGGKSWVPKGSSDWYDSSSNWTSEWNSGGGGGKGKFGLTASVKGLSDLLWQREMKTWENEEKEAWTKYEKEEREKREKEAADRKKEREDFQKEMRDDHKKLVDRLTAGSGSNEAQGKKVGKKKKKEDDSEEEEEKDDDYKVLLRSKTVKKQKVVSPIDADDWQGWQASSSEATTALALFKGKTKLKKKDVEQKGILEIAEALDDEGKVGSREELQKKYRKNVGKSAPGRWSRVDLLVGLLADELDDEEDDE